MIAYLKGQLTYKSPAMVHVEVNGIGYEVQISLNTFSKIRDAKECLLHTYLHIKEDAHTLYGFYEEAEKQIFLQLISISGVGASIARMILSSMKPEEVQAAIVQEDEKTLASVKGIGPKTAKRLILELKDKITRQKDIPHAPAAADNTLQNDALNALIALGIARAAAETAVKKALRQEPVYSVEELIKKALKTL